MKKFSNIVLFVFALVLTLFAVACNDQNGKAEVVNSVNIVGVKGSTLGSDASFELKLTDNTFGTSLKVGEEFKYISPSSSTLSDGLMWVIDDINSERNLMKIRLSGTPRYTHIKREINVTLTGDALEKNEFPVIADMKGSTIEVPPMSVDISLPDTEFTLERGVDIEPVEIRLTIKGAKFAAINIASEAQKADVSKFFNPQIPGLNYKIKESIPSDGSDTLAIEITGVPEKSLESSFVLTVASNYLKGANANIGVKGGNYKVTIDRPTTTASITETTVFDAFTTSEIEENISIDLTKGRFDHNSVKPGSSVRSWFTNSQGSPDAIQGLSYTLASYENRNTRANITVSGMANTKIGATYPYNVGTFITIPADAIKDQPEAVVVDTKDSYIIVRDAPLSNAKLDKKIELHAATNTTAIDITGVINLSHAYFKDVAENTPITSWLTNENGEALSDIGLSLIAISTNKDEASESATLNYRLSGTPNADRADMPIVITIPKDKYESSRGGNASSQKPITVDTLGSVYDIRSVSATITSDKQEIFGGIGVELQKDYAADDRQKYTIDVALTNAHFSDEIAADSEVQDWFKKADGSAYTVPGLSYKIRTVSNEMDGTAPKASATVELSGRPTAISSENITLVIPASSIKYNLGEFTVADKVTGAKSVYNIIEAPTLEISESTIASFVNEDIVNGSFTVKVDGSTFDETQISKLSNGLKDWIKPVENKGGAIEGLTYTFASLSSDKTTITIKVEGKTATKLEDSPFTVEIPRSVFTDKFATLSPGVSRAKYSITDRPSAEVMSAATVYGAKDGESVKSTIFVDLKEAALNYGSAGTLTATSWFENMPSGLVAVAKVCTDEGANKGKIQIDISGVPRVVSSDPLKITIPNNVYTYANSNITVANYPARAVVVDIKNSAYDIKEVSATVSLSNGTEINAVVGTNAFYSLTVSLENAEFDSSVSVGSDVSAWFVSSLNSNDTTNNDKQATNLSYVITEKTNATSIKIVVAGEAMDAFSVFPVKAKALKVVIPSSAIARNLKTITADTGLIVYNLYKAPTATMATQYLYGYANRKFPEQTLTINVTSDIPLVLTKDTNIDEYFSPRLTKISYVVSSVTETSNGYDLVVTVKQTNPNENTTTVSSSEIGITLPKSAFKDNLASVVVDTNGSANRVVSYPTSTVTLRSTINNSPATLTYRAAVNGTVIENVTGNTDLIYVHLSGAKFSGLSVGNSVASWFKKEADVNASAVISGVEYKIAEVDPSGAYVAIKLTGTATATTSEKFVIVVPNNVYTYNVDFLERKIDKETIKSAMNSSAYEVVNLTSSITFSFDNTYNAIYGINGAELQQNYTKDDKQKYTLSLSLTNAHLDETYTSNVANTGIASWFKKADGSSYTVDGLTYSLSGMSNTTSSGNPKYSSTATITIAGVPKVPSEENITLVIPSEAVKYNLGAINVTIPSGGLKYHILSKPSITSTDAIIASFVGEEIVDGTFTLTANGTTFSSADINKTTNGLSSWIKGVNNASGVVAGLTYSYSSLSSDNTALTIKVGGTSTEVLEGVQFTVEVPKTAFTDKFVALEPISGTTKYSITPRPTSSLTEDSSIYGAINSGTISKTIYATINHAIIDYSAITDVSAWFEGLPAGLSVTAKECTTAPNVGAIQFDITGEPTAETSAPMKITIPASVYSYKNTNIEETKYPKQDIIVDVKGSVYDIKDVSATVTLDDQSSEINAVAGTDVDYSLTISLKNAEFVDSIKADTSVSSWFVSSLNTSQSSYDDGTVTKLSYKVAERVSASELKVKISGNISNDLGILPLTAKALNVVIPSSAIAHNVKRITAVTNGIVYNLYRKPTASMAQTVIYGYTYHPFVDQTFDIDLTSDIPLSLLVGDSVKNYFKTTSISDLGYNGTLSTVDYTVDALTKTADGYKITVKLSQNASGNYETYVNGGLNFYVELPRTVFEKQLADVTVSVQGGGTNSCIIDNYPSAIVSTTKGGNASAIILRGNVDGNPVEAVTGNNSTFYIRTSGAVVKDLKAGDIISNWFVDENGTQSVVSGLTYMIGQIESNSSSSTIRIDVKGTATAANSNKFGVSIPQDAYTYIYPVLVGNIPNERLLGKMGENSGTTISYTAYQILGKIGSASYAMQGGNTVTSITGETGSNLNDVKLNIRITNASLPPRSDDRDVSAWFYSDDAYSVPYTVKGLTYTLKSNTAGSNALDIVISGTPEFDANEKAYPIDKKLYVKIPSSYLNYNAGDVKTDTGVSYFIEKSVRIYVVEENHKIKGISGMQMPTADTFTIKIDDPKASVKFVDAISGTDITSWFDELDAEGNPVHGLTYTASTLSDGKLTLTVSVTGNPSGNSDDTTLTDEIAITIPAAALSGYNNAFNAENNGLSYYIMPAVTHETPTTGNFVANVGGNTVTKDFTYVVHSVKFADSITPSYNVSDWFFGARPDTQFNVPGLAYTVKSVTNADISKGEHSSTLVITISGIPTSKIDESDKQIGLNIPGSAYEYLDSAFSSYPKNTIMCLGLSEFEIYEIKASLTKAVDIYGFTGKKLEDRETGSNTIELPITITDTKFVNVPTNPDDISSWFGGDLEVLNGLTASIKTAIGSSGSDTMTIVISGVPTQNGSTAETNRNLSITIPGKYLEKEGLDSISVNTNVGGTQSRWLILNHAVISIAEDAVVAGLSGLSMTNYESPRQFTLRVDGNTFKDFGASKDITGKIVPSISGLIYTAKPGKESIDGGYETLIVDVSGTPTSTSSASITNISFTLSELHTTQTTTPSFDGSRGTVRYNVTSLPSLTFIVGGSPSVGWVGKDFGANPVSDARYLQLRLNNGYWSDTYATIGKIVSDATPRSGYDNYQNIGPLYFHDYSSGYINSDLNLNGLKLVVTELNYPITINGETKYREIVLRFKGTPVNDSAGSTNLNDYYIVNTASGLRSAESITSRSGEFFESANADIKKLTYTMPTSPISKINQRLFEAYAYPALVCETTASSTKALYNKSTSATFVIKGAECFNPDITTAHVYLKDKNGTVPSYVHISNVRYKEQRDGMEYYETIEVTIGGTSSTLGTQVSGTKNEITIVARPGAFKYNTGNDLDVNMGKGCIVYSRE